MTTKGAILVFSMGFFITVGLLRAEGAFFGERERGWHWYEPGSRDQVPGISEDTDIRKGESLSPPSSKPKTPAEVVAAYRKELENRLAKAWLSPTPQNIQAYQEMQKDMLDRSQAFSSVWMQTVFQTPHLDYTLISPVNQQARHIQIDQEKQRNSQTIHALKEDYGLFFFFSGDCPYCHQFAPVVKRFAEHYGWQVLAISVDGGKVAEFPNAVADEGLFESWGGEILPALFAVNPQTEHVIPIAYGLTSLDQMETRLMALADKKPVNIQPINGQKGQS